MNKKKKIVIAIIGILVIIQFIRPAQNTGNIYGDNDVTQTIETSDEIKQILEKSCFDCHSNNTIYPWYSNIQPVGYWLAHHVNEGKEELNFSEFKTFKLKRQIHKLEETIEMINEGEMPLNSYLWMHSQASLSEYEKNALINWANAGIKHLKATE